MTAHDVLIADEVLIELRPIARQENREIGDLVNRVLQDYLWQIKEQKIDHEMAAYRAMHTELKKRFPGEFVAIHDQKLIDHDADRRALSRRVRQRYGNAAVLIVPVKDQPEREFSMRSPRIERG